MTRFSVLLFCLFCLSAAAGAAEPDKEPPAKAAQAQSEAAPPVGPPVGISVGKSGLPLPRFVSTRSNSVNVRSGPGERYPVVWVLKKKGLPVEVVAEYDNWRRIRDWDGTEGWVHQAMLSGRRAAAVHPGPGVLRDQPAPAARPLAELAEGVLVRLEGCNGSWCEVRIDEIEGWVHQKFLWGVYPGEKLE